MAKQTWNPDTAAGRLDIAIERELLFGFLPNCPTCGALRKQNCRHARYDREIIIAHPARIALLRDEIELWVTALALARTYGGSVAADAQAAVAALGGTRAPDRQTLRLVRSELAHLRERRTP